MWTEASTSCLVNLDTGTTIQWNTKEDEPGIAYLILQSADGHQKRLLHKASITRAQEMMQRFHDTFKAKGLLVEL